MSRSAAVLCSCLLLTAHALAIDLSRTELRGKQIFLTGTSPTNATISAFLGADRTELPASAAPCGSCHGTDGRGRPEGGVNPSDITWGELRKSYGHDHQYGRRHPAFDDSTVAAAITGGVDPAGNVLDSAMPVYRMDQGDLAALVAYLKRLEKDIDPGVSADSVKLATLLPLSGPAASQGGAMLAVLTAFIQQINEGGGVNGRLIELEVIPLGLTPQQTIANVNDVLLKGEIFALVATYSVHIEAELARLLEQQKIPVVGPFTHEPHERPHLSRYTFYLYSGTRQVIQSLAAYAAGAPQTDRGRMVLMGSGIELLNRYAESIADNGKSVVVLAYTASDFDPSSLATQLRASDDLYFLGTAAELGRLLRQLAGTGQAPRLLLPASTATPELLKASAIFNRRIFIAYPTLPRDISDNGRRAYGELAANGALSSDHFATQIATFAAATVLVEAMKRVGHDLSRERLIEVLESLQEYDSGLTPPISFGLNRRIGALGAHIVTVDLAQGRFVPVAGWSDLE